MLTSIVTVNCRSALTGRWSSRSKTLGDVILPTGAAFVAAQECYATKRWRLTNALKDPGRAKNLPPKMQAIGAHKGKVLYYDRDTWKMITGSVRRYSLGDGKHAIGAQFVHRTQPTVELVAVSLHLLNKAKNGAKRQAELRRLLDFVNRDFDPELPVLLAGDFNDDDLNEIYGPSPYNYGDLRFDMPAKKRINDRYDTYQGFKYPAPQHSKGIDRIVGRYALGVSYKVLKHSRPYGSDHWPVLVQARLLSSPVRWDQ